MSAWRGLLSERRSGPALLLVGGVALVLRLAFLYRAPVFLTGDSQSHYLPGFDLALGYGFDPELRRTPGYALFVAGVIGLFGEELRGLAFAQHLAGVVTAVLTCALGRIVFGPVVGLIGGLLVALNGALVLSEHSVMTETLFGTLLVATLLALVVAIRGGRRRWLLATGVLLGLATLTRPVGQILVPIIPLALWLSSFNVQGSTFNGGGTGAGGRVLEWRGRVRRVLIRSAVVGLGFAIVLGPWMVRNLAEHGSLTASGGLGRSLVARTIKYDFGYFENDAPVAEGDLKGAVRQYVRGKRNTIRNSRSVRSTQAGLMKEMELTQAQADGLMRQVALDEIARRPGYYAVGSLGMAWQIVSGKEKEDALLTRWNQRTDKDWVEQWDARLDHLVMPTSRAEQTEYGRAEAIVNLYQPAELGAAMPLLALLGVGVSVLMARYRLGLVVGISTVALVLASAALDGPVPRYRYPVDPLIGLMAVGGVVAIAGLLAKRFAQAGPSQHSASDVIPMATRDLPASQASPSLR